MLARVSRRQKLKHNALARVWPAFERLQLPWLCPVLYKQVSYRPGPRSIARKLDVTQSKRRNLASAASHYEPLHDESVPFDDHPLPMQYGSPKYHSDLSAVPYFDPQSPLVIKTSLATAPPRFRDVDSLGSDINDIQQILSACLHVGRLERGAAIVRRFSRLYRKDAAQLINAHNLYLDALISEATRTKDQELLKQAQTWFEVDIRTKGIEPNGTTYALMIRAAFQEAKTSKVERTVRRYISLAENANLKYETVVNLSTMLDDQRIGWLSRIAPMTFSRVDDSELSTVDEDSPDHGNTDFNLEGSLPPIKHTNQKGFGLSALTKSLSSLASTTPIPSPQGLDGNKEQDDPAQLMMLQHTLEDNTYTSALERWRLESINKKDVGVNHELGAPGIGALLWQWHEKLVPLIREEIRKADEAENKAKRGAADHDRCIHGPFLRYLKPETLSAVTILTCMSSISQKGVDQGHRTSHLVTNLGKMVQDESYAELEKKKNNRQGLWQNVLNTNRQAKRAKLLTRYQSQSHRQISSSQISSIPKIQIDVPKDRSWSESIRAKVGAVLITQLVQAAKVNAVHTDPQTGMVSRESQPAFWNTFQYDSGKRIGMIRMNSAMIEKLTKEPVSGVLSKHLPMVVEPKPWKGYRDGGYLHHKVQFVRTVSGDVHIKTYADAASHNGDLDQMYAGINVLSRTPWKINQDVFNIMVDAWNSGEEIANFPPESPNFELPPEPEASVGSRQHFLWDASIKEVENKRAGFHSTRCFQNFQLEIARAYLGKTFYFPHNVDFRGRAYPIPPYLNHMGADNCRGLLVFGKGKELGDSGLRWLQIHLANVYGYDKASFEDRRMFTINHLANVYDSATNPLKGRRWWLNAEDPWQCLAACIELTKALDSSDPRRFVSSLPVHQDGTCNGLQHYAALGGDSIGAKQVNLEPGDHPSDIYTAICEAVKSEIVDDATEGLEMAKFLKGKLTRKVVKQTVMTNVYGVTFYGARQQVQRQLEEILPNLPGTPELNIHGASVYVARKIFKALSTMFNGAHHIQHWLGECGSRICDALTPEQIEWVESYVEGKVDETPYSVPGNKGKSPIDEKMCFKSSVIWTTPLKMPVVQPYRTTVSRLVTTSLSNIVISQPALSDPVSKRKQLAAFPPNFIHSLDAAHMILSALKCDQLGLTFASVHDSFWTHAGDIDTLNTILRDSFIRMHSENVVGRLAAEFSARYKGYMYLASVEANSAAGKKIRALRRQTGKSGGIKSKGGWLKELLAERRRLRLLASANEKDQAEGNSMITPSRIFSELADERELSALEDCEKTDEEEASQSTLEEFEADAQPDVKTARTLGFRLAEPELEDAMVENEGPLGADAKSVPERKKPSAKIKVWLPLTFPPVPEKGDFDISRLQNSKYFFS